MKRSLFCRVKLFICLVLGHSAVVEKEERQLLSWRWWSVAWKDSAILGN